MDICTECPAAIRQTPGKRTRFTCSATCRKRRQVRTRDARLLARAADLLHRQTAAVIASDADALAAVDREAAELFGT
ncbi:hypothetical protein [Micromonospora sp. NPDC003241]